MPNISKIKLLSEQGQEVFYLKDETLREQIAKLFGWSSFEELIAKIQE